MSDWRERSNKRRDERQTKVPVIRAPSASKKDTKKWCRGKAGVEHKPVCMTHDEWENRSQSSAWSKDWRVLVCEDCGKQLDYWWPVPFMKGAAPPAWLTTDPK
jgi:hypothetical protein